MSRGRDLHRNIWWHAELATDWRLGWPWVELRLWTIAIPHFFSPYMSLPVIENCPQSKCSFMNIPNIQWTSIIHWHREVTHENQTAVYRQSTSVTSLSASVYTSTSAIWHQNHRQVETWWLSLTDEVRLDFFLSNGLLLNKRSTYRRRILAMSIWRHLETVDGRSTLTDVQSSTNYLQLPSTSR